MLKAFALVVTALASLTASLNIPSDLPDGTWIFELDKDGNATSAPMRADALGRRGPAFTKTLSRRQEPPPLPSPQPLCARDWSRLQSSADYSLARQFFNGLCDMGEHYAPNSAIAIVEGTAMAYMCNLGSENRCWRQEFEEANAIIDTWCGTESVAIVRVAYWNKVYGRSNRGNPICS